ncbi:MAG TPA: phosphoribosylformylglycinamidine synthase subunit PurL [Candidatus Elarobacter sp.]|jgi:phosphoribosylformylglycinamidine synthase|nr:phosphoribosylformylglycinamidine synthase subunit PurL [Candidatus Elarobacter sp.]
MTAVLDDALARGRRLGLALSDDELRRIAEHLGRVPTDTELFAFDAQWSEHCSYKSSREHLKKLPTEGPSVLLGVGEDAGIVRLGEWNGETYGIVVAHESHNHPSQVVPFEGAATGIGGIVRDVLCMGAEVIGVADPLRFGRLENEHCRYVAQQVVDGIAAYGNAIGVPNVGGDVFIDESFDDNVLVNVVALGLVKEKDIIHSRAPQGSAGWDIILVGKATDRSGFGGASFSSLTLDEEDAEANKGAVQVPDPFLKNVLMRATYAVFAQLRAQNVTAGFKDLGAGGLAGCSAELCAAGGMGAEVELERVSTAQRDLPPEVIAIGETQERLCWIVPPSFTPLLLSIYNETYSLPRIARGACAAVIGKVTETGRYVAKHHGETVMDVDLEFLTGGVRYSREYVLPSVRTESVAERDEAVRRAFPDAKQSPFDLLERILAHRDVGSRAPIFRRYDGVVRGCTAIPPGFADAGVLVPVPGAPLAVALGIGGNPRYGKVDPHRASVLAVAEAVAQVTAVGAAPVGLTDCLNFGDPTVPEQMGAFVAAVHGLAEAARALRIPFVSGNVSLYNRSSSGNHVAPSPIVSCIGTMADVSRAVTGAFKREGSVIGVVGVPQHAYGGSVLAEVTGMAAATLPEIDYERFARACRLVREGIARGLLLAVRDVSDGGILAAIAEMAVAASPNRTLGASLRHYDTIYDVDLWLADDVIPYTDMAVWFAEFPGFVCEMHDWDAFASLGRELGVKVHPVGETTAEPYLRADYRHEISLDQLREAWEAPLRDFYGSAA